MLKNTPFCSFVLFLIVLVTPFNKILECSRAWTIFMLSFISLFEIIKVVVRGVEDEGRPEPCIFFWILAWIAEASAVIPNGAKIFFAEGTATFISGPANLLNNDPENPLDWIILEICKPVDILLLNAFFSLVFCLVVNNNSWGRSFPSNIFKFILKVVPVLSLTTVFSCFSCLSVNFTFTLLYSTIYTIYRTFIVPSENCSIVSFDCLRI